MNHGNPAPTRQAANSVAIVCRDGAVYPAAPPYHPSESYPELSFLEQTGPPNPVYQMARETLRMLRLDEAHADTAAWNPLSGLVQPGETVFLKPNMIAAKHLHKDEWDSVITHGSVIRVMVDYVYLALGGKGKILIGDGPQTDSDWGAILERMGLLEIRRFYKEQLGFDIEILDLRDLHYVNRDGIYVDTEQLAGDPRGRTVVDLGRDSMFAELDGKGKLYYGAFYDWEETNRHHREGKHEYAFSSSPLLADVFINIPKLKTHKKCGLTVNLKSMVGLNANKNWLPHYVFGSPDEGGDQFPAGGWRTKLENLIVMKAKRLLVKQLGFFKTVARKAKPVGYEIFGETEETIRSGNWHGNDTVWRMSLDLNRILHYGRADGTMRPATQGKRYFSIVDGVAAMEGDGPVSGERRSDGVLVAGINPVAVDTVCARLMGFDPRKIPLIHRSYDTHAYPLAEGEEEDIRPVSNVEAWNRSIDQWQREDMLGFAPHFGWAGHIEWQG